MLPAEGRAGIHSGGGVRGQKEGARSWGKTLASTGAAAGLPPLTPVERNATVPELRLRQGGGTEIPASTSFLKAGIEVQEQVCARD